MKTSLWNQRIPTLLGLFLLVFVSGITIFFLQQGILFQTNASPSTLPENIRLSNITDTSFTVSYTTTTKTGGSISYGESEALGKVGLDDRDQATGKIASYQVHSITVRNLSPSQTYSFAILSGGTIYKKNGKNYTVTTGKPITAPPVKQNPLTGKIVTSETPAEGIVYATAKGVQVISALIDSDGTYLIPLNTLRDTSLLNYSSLSESTSLSLLVETSEGNATGTVLSSQTNPVPNITIGNMYDFTLSSSPQLTSSASNVSFPSFDATDPDPNGPNILSPKREEKFSDQQPEFKGQALPNESVEITVHSAEAIETTVTADKNGLWSYRPTTSLSPGNHTIKITTRDKSGIMKTILQSFVVNAQGSQFIEPSVSPTQPTDVPIPTTVTPEVAEPTTAVIPTASPVPTLIVSNTTPFPTQPIDQPGSSFTTSIGILASIFIGIGLLLFFINHKKISV